MSSQNVLGIVVELGILYIAYAKWKVTVDKQIESLDLQIREVKIDIKEVQSLSSKITNLDTTSQLMKQDLDYIKKDYEIQARSNAKMKEDIHEIKGSMATIQSYFKQILENESK
jgi:prefoldin subunit 5